MSVSKLFFGALTIVWIVFSIFFPMAQAQSAASAPAPTSDGQFTYMPLYYHSLVTIITYNIEMTVTVEQK